MKRKSLINSIAVVSILSAAISCISCGKKESTILTTDNNIINESATIPNETVSESSICEISNTTESESSYESLDTSDSEDSKEEDNESIPLIEGICGITPKEIESKTYNEVKQSLYEYALSDPEQAKNITVLEYYGEDVCIIEYEKMKEEYSSFPASFWDEFTYDVFASESIYEECNLGYDPEADKKAYEEMQKRWAEEASSGGSGYVPGQNRDTSLDNLPTGTGTTWESNEPGLGEANLQ